jgi:hypothetical protein
MIRNVLNRSSSLRLKKLVLILTLIGMSFLVSSCAHEQKTESDKLKNETYQLEREVATFE